MISSFAFAGTSEPNYIWKKNKIKVCWWDKATPTLNSLKVIGPTLHKILNAKYFETISMTDLRKNIIKNKINNTFTVNSVGIQFVGWKNCSDKLSQNSDVIIYAISDFKIKSQYKDLTRIKSSSHFRYENKKVSSFIKNVSGSSNVALHDANNIKGEPQAHLILFENSNERKLYTDDYLKLNAIHEFAHLAGLRHEQIRYTESDKDPFCKMFPNLYKKEEESVGDHTWFTSQYDQQSIMSYCFFYNLTDISHFIKLNKKEILNKRITHLDKFFKSTCKLSGPECLSDHIRLSRGDKHALKCLYKYNKELRDEICHEDYELKQD